MARQTDLASARETSVAQAAEYFKRNRRALKVHVHDGPLKSLRTETHRGREIKLTATYDIRIDGRRVGGHLEVGNDGHVHYHGLPNYAWGSMVDMCKQLIDSFPEHFPSGRTAPLRAVTPRRAKAEKKAKKKAASTKKKAGRRSTTKRG